MNLPNLISLFRLILVPIIAVLLLITKQGQITINNYEITFTWLIASILFIIAILSDWLDGHLARKWNQVTSLGKFLDPVADKALTSVVLVILSYFHVIPVWMTLIFIFRDLVLDVVRQILATQQIVLPANWYGKWKFTLMTIGIMLMLVTNYQNFGGKEVGNTLFDQFGIVNQCLMMPLYLALILSIYSAITYIYPQRKILFKKK